jgi:hypothetical protein
MDQYTWVKVLSWRPVEPESTRRCRWGKDQCERRADFELDRSMTGGKQRWWAYCGEHVREFGNRIMGNEVQTQVPLSSSAATRGWVS